MPALLAFLPHPHELPWWAWVGFFAFVILLLAVDLGAFKRKPAHVISVGESLRWCALWFGVSMAFAALVWLWQGPEPGQHFVAAYLVELALSMDNVFVFILIFAFFKVAPKWQYRVLVWGIIGAVVLRIIFILIGVGLIARFHWILYIFGAFLVYTGIKMALPGGGAEEVHPENNPAVRLFRKFFPVSSNPHEGRFFVRENGRFLATSLFLVLIVIATTDIIFALDSIPAVLSITQESFIALTSNVFAVLGLRSLFFAISGVMQLFRFLKFGLALILTFIGVKMLIEHWVDISIGFSLGVIAGIIGFAILLSLLIKEKPKS